MVEFNLDKQTISDLGIFSEGKSEKSISDFFNQTKTFGGKKFLFHLMKNPVSDVGELRQRIELIRYLSASEFELKINSSQIEFIEHYLRLNIAPLRNNFMDAFIQNLSYRINPNNNYYIIKSGVQQLMYLLIHLKKKFESDAETKFPVKLQAIREKILGFIHQPGFKTFLNKQRSITYFELNKLDNLFRKKYKNQLQEVIQLVYKLDACISIAKVARQNNLAFPDYSESEKPFLRIENLYHPLLENAVPNSVEIPQSTNLCFLTGPNMAGKSTFLKSVGLAIYLAHIGFPVPAEKMTTSVYQGIITTINLSDNMNLGYSHFYSEVHRIKETVLKLKEQKRLFVIFDELFRGTNVKDAFDASLLIIKSFTNIQDSTFFISTHITEVAEQVKEVESIQFKYFDSKLVHNTPTYEYKLEDGISYERLGLYILRNEKIIEMLDSMNQNNNS